MVLFSIFLQKSSIFPYFLIFFLFLLYEYTVWFYNYSLDNKGFMKKKYYIVFDTLTKKWEGLNFIPGKISVFCTDSEMPKGRFKSFRVYFKTLYPFDIPIKELYIDKDCCIPLVIKDL